MKFKFTKMQNRKGAIAVLMAFLLPVLLILASLCINVAYMQLTRTELMVATDAAARAGGRAMSELQNVEQAKAAAQATAALNDVAGSPLRVNYFDYKNEIEFGDSNPKDDTDRFIFEKVATDDVRFQREDATSIRITGALDEDSLGGQLDALFPTFGMLDQFDLHWSSVAMQVDRDISLILDRSGSMNDPPVYVWPQGFSPFSYSSLNAGIDAGLITTQVIRNRRQYYYAPGQNSQTYQDWLWEHHLGLGEPPETAWEELKKAVDVFLDVLNDTDQDEQVSLASYATDARIGAWLETDYNVIRDTMDRLFPSGRTAIGDGMREGMRTILSTTARPFAAKTLLVMTDGKHNEGVSPQSVAREVVRDFDVTIHTVTFGGGADQTAMAEVAEIGGGEHYHANTGSELQAIFEEIANNLPTIMTQ